MEHRTETRVESHVRFFVHVHECEADHDLVGTSLTCEAVDFSVHGLQLVTDEDLPIGTMLDVTIGIGDPFAMYLLRGEVRWVRKRSDEVFMGVLIREADGTDLADWIGHFDETFHPDENED